MKSGLFRELFVGPGIRVIDFKDEAAGGFVGVIMEKPSSWRAVFWLTTAERQQIKKPPARSLRRAVRWLTTAKGFREVFEPTFVDMETEFFEALSRKELFEARKIVIACHFNVCMILVTRPVVRSIAKVMGWMKAG